MSSLALKELRNKPDVPHLNVLVELIDVLMFTAGAVEHLKPVVAVGRNFHPLVLQKLHCFVNHEPPALLKGYGQIFAVGNGEFIFSKLVTEFCLFLL